MPTAHKAKTAGKLQNNSKKALIGQSQHFRHSSRCKSRLVSQSVKSFTVLGASQLVCLNCSCHQYCWLAWLQISMVDGALFDALEALARGIRGKQEPFGGIQLILAGQMHDFSAMYI